MAQYAEGRCFISCRDIAPLYLQEVNLFNLCFTAACKRNLLSRLLRPASSFLRISLYIMVQG